MYRSNAEFVVGHQRVSGGTGTEDLAVVADVEDEGVEDEIATSEEHIEIRRLKKENAELRRTNELLKSASALFASELDRTTTK